MAVITSRDFPGVIPDHLVATDAAAKRSGDMAKLYSEEGRRRRISPETTRKMLRLRHYGFRQWLLKEAKGKRVEKALRRYFGKRRTLPKKSMIAASSLMRFSLL